MIKKLFNQTKLYYREDKTLTKKTKRRSITYSMIVKFIKSEQEFIEYIVEKKSKATFHSLLGSLIHTIILEEHRVGEKYLIQPDRDLTESNSQLKHPKVCFEDISASHLAKKSFLREFGFIYKNFDKCLNEQNFSGKMNHRGFCFNYEGIADILCIGETIMILDIKTVSVIENFEKSFEEYMYHVQAEMYMSCISSIYQEKIVEFLFVIIEKSYPFRVIHKRYNHCAEKMQIIENKIIEAIDYCIDKNLLEHIEHEII